MECVVVLGKFILTRDFMISLGLVPNRRVDHVHEHVSEVMLLCISTGRAPQLVAVQARTFYTRHLRALQ